MQGLATAQGRYDRHLPPEIMEPPEQPTVDAMEELRAGLAVPLDAEDISSSFYSALLDSNDDIQLLRLLAAGADAAALAILKRTLHTLAKTRAAYGAN